MKRLVNTLSAGHRRGALPGSRKTVRDLQQAWRTISHEGAAELSGTRQFVTLDFQQWSAVMGT